MILHLHPYYIQSTGGDPKKMHFKTQKCMYYIQLLFIGFTISDLAQLLPTDKTGVCSNAATARFLLQYKCLTYDLSIITKEEDKCR